MKRTFGVLSALTLLLPAAAQSQIAWDAPSLLRPGAPSGLSVFLTDADPSSSLGVTATWRRAPAPAGIGFRAGLANGRRDHLAALFAVDVSGSLGSLGAGGSGGSAGGPDVMWWSGAGLGVDSSARLSFPAGLVLGWEGRNQEVTFYPYVGGHAVLDVLTAGDGDMRLDGTVDLGVDLGFSSGWMVRFGASVGGRNALAIGVRLPGT